MSIPWMCDGSQVKQLSDPSSIALTLGTQRVCAPCRHHNTTTLIDINYNPHPCTIDGVLCHVDQERSLHRLGDLIEYLFVHEDNASERDMFKMIYD